MSLIAKIPLIELNVLARGKELHSVWMNLGRENTTLHLNYLVCYWEGNLHIFFLLPFFSPISWYPIGSYSLVSSLQLPYGLRRGEGREPCVLRNTTLPSRTASCHNAHLTRKPAAPMWRKKHCTPGDHVRVHRARPATRVASARWDKDIPAGQTLP